MASDTAQSGSIPVNPQPAESPGAAATPAMRQYLEQKSQVPDALLLFRMGDFYETFFEDARTISRVLGLTLTARDKNSPNPIPLAGVPYHAVDGYVARLVKAGYKVAISEQVEDPRLAKGVVRRAIVRIITPGTLTDERLLEAGSDNWLAAIAVEPVGRGRPGAGMRARGIEPKRLNAEANRPSSLRPAASRDTPIGLAAVELASGRFFAQTLPSRRLADELARLRPAELLVRETPIDQSDAVTEELRATVPAVITPRPAHVFDESDSHERLCRHFGVRSLAGFGFDEGEPSLRAAGALIEYLEQTQKSSLQHILRLEPRRDETFVAVDRATLAALEVERTVRDGAREGTLLSAVNRTVTPMGARRLRDWLCFPLRDARQIRRRQDAIADLRADRIRLRKLRDLLAGLRDVERIAARLGVSRANPRDLIGLGESIASFATIRGVLESPSGLLATAGGTERPTPPAAATVEAPTSLLAECSARLGGLDQLGADLLGAIRPDAPPTTRDGNVIAAGFHAELDRLRATASDGQRWLAEYQAAEVARTGIPTLKIGYNQVFGYYIEITHAQRDKAPPDYVRKQTVRNAERYITDALKRFEQDAQSAQERSIALEVELFEQVCRRAAGELAGLQSAAEALATLDILAGLAELSLERDYCRPELLDAPLVRGTDDAVLLPEADQAAADRGEHRPARVPRNAARRIGRVLEIDQGRHPVLDQTLSGRFVPNDCRLSPEGDRLLIITGPNMAGKSTYIRQVALLTLLAQTGSWVPARSMRFDPVDRIFARVGAADEIARGQSTFMVEMVETARILHHATPDSLVVLDEIGRGTSTFDGLALAWAISEHIARRIGCRTLFATHYHELTELAEGCRGVANFNVAVRETTRADGTGRDVVFLHRIVPGGADQSYGIHVARMAGVPPTVVARAVEVLAELERHLAAERPKLTGEPPQATLFPAAPPVPAWWQALADEVARIELDQTTPLDALMLLRDLQARLRDAGR